MFVVKTSINKCREHCVKGEPKEKWTIRADKEFHNIQHTGKQTSGNGSKQIISNLVWDTGKSNFYMFFVFSIKKLPPFLFSLTIGDNLWIHIYLLLQREAIHEPQDFSFRPPATLHPEGTLRS